jgi:hypothetical protein
MTKRSAGLGRAVQTKKQLRRPRQLSSAAIGRLIEKAIEAKLVEPLAKIDRELRSFSDAMNQAMRFDIPELNRLLKIIAESVAKLTPLEPSSGNMHSARPNDPRKWK